MAIPESWIVDPEGETLAVLQLQGDAYVERVWRRGDVAESPLLPGLRVPVAEVLDAD